MSQVRVVRTEGVVEVWVPHGTDEAAVQSVVSAYAEAGTRVVIYRSGDHDLVDVAAALLHANA